MTTGRINQGTMIESSPDGPSRSTPPRHTSIRDDLRVCAGGRESRDANRHETASFRPWGARTSAESTGIGGPRRRIFKESTTTPP
jgi:hypothetical protein